MPPPSPTPRLICDADGLTGAAHLLVDFNREFDEPAPPVERLAARLQQCVTAGDTSVLVSGAPAVAVAVVRFRASLWADAAEAYLAELYVQPRWRGRGIGTRLLDAVIAEARRRGAATVDLTTTEADVAARHVYERRGFDCHEGRGSGPRSLYYELTLE